MKSRTREQEVVYRLLRKAKLVPLGLCVKCGKSREGRAGVICIDCRRKSSVDNARRRRERFEMNLCIRCGSEMQGKDLCHSSCRPCRERHAAYMAAKRAQEVRQ